MINAREAWANLSIGTVQQAVGAAASELTNKASELTIAATENITIKSVQLSVGTVASGMAKVASKVARQALSRVPGLISPMILDSEDEGMTLVNRDMSPRRRILIAQQTQIGYKNWEPPMNVFQQEGIKEKNKAMQVDEWLDEIPRRKGVDAVAGRKHGTVHQQSSGDGKKAKSTPGRLHDVDGLLRKRKYGSEGSRYTSSLKDHLSNLGYESTEQILIFGKYQDELSAEHHPRGYGPKFSRYENQYDTLGVSNAWKRPERQLIGDEKKAVIERWKEQDDRSARDGGGRKTSTANQTHPSRISLRAAKSPVTTADGDQEDMAEQGEIWLAGIGRDAVVTFPFLDPQDLTSDARNEAMVEDVDLGDQ